MNLALLADSRKNELLMNFCLAYRSILSKHQLVSFFTTARLIEGTLRIPVQPLVGNLVAGVGHLTARATYNELDAVIYLRDPMEDSYLETIPLQRACDTNSIPFASNLASAELLILAIEQGDLDYRANLQERNRFGSNT